MIRAGARIALLHYLDGEKRYILAPIGLQVGQTIVSDDSADILPGNHLTIRHSSGDFDSQHRVTSW